MDRIATTTGLYPLPDGAKSELRSLKGKQRDDLISGDEADAITQVYDEARAAVIGWQQDADLDRVVEGQLRWDDMICHPLAVHEQVATGGLERYYDNNNFYREVAVQGPLTPDGDVAMELAAAEALVEERGLQAVIPGPFSLSRLATDEHYDDEGAFLEGLAEFLAGEIDQCPSVETAIVLEPSLGIGTPDDPSAAGDAIDTVAAAFAAETDVLIQPYWGVTSAEMYPRLLDGAADGVGFDLVQAPDAAAALVRDFGTPSVAAFGVVDGQNTRVESPSEIEDRIATVLDEGTAPDRAYLSPNTESFYLPVGPLEDKLDVLGRASTQPEVQA